MLKLTFCLRRLPNLTLAAFQDYWLNNHGPLVRRLQPALGMVRYVQLHRLEGDLAAGIAADRLGNAGMFKTAILLRPGRSAVGAQPCGRNER